VADEVPGGKKPKLQSRTSPTLLGDGTPNGRFRRVRKPKNRRKQGKKKSPNEGKQKKQWECDVKRRSFGPNGKRGKTKRVVKERRTSVTVNHDAQRGEKLQSSTNGKRKPLQMGEMGNGAVGLSTWCREGFFEQTFAPGRRDTNKEKGGAVPRAGGETRTVLG